MVLPQIHVTIVRSNQVWFKILVRCIPLIPRYFNLQNEQCQQDQHLHHSSPGTRTWTWSHDLSQLPGLQEVDKVLQSSWGQSMPVSKTGFIDAVPPKTHWTITTGKRKRQQNHTIPLWLSQTSFLSWNLWERFEKIWKETSHLLWFQSSIWHLWGSPFLRPMCNSWHRLLLLLENFGPCAFRTSRASQSSDPVRDENSSSNSVLFRLLPFGKIMLFSFGCQCGAVRKLCLAF